MSNIPDLKKLDVLKGKMATMLAIVTAPVEVAPVSPSPVPPPAVPPRKAARSIDLEKEVKEDKLYQEVERAEEEVSEAVRQTFQAFDDLQKRILTLHYKKELGGEEESLLDALKAVHNGLKEMFMADIDLYEIWLADYMVREDEYNTTLDLVKRGVLRQISAEEAASLDASWDAYGKLSREDRSARSTEGKFVNPRPEFYWRVREDPRNPDSTEFFTRRFYKRDEWDGGQNPWTSERRRLLAAYSAHHQRMREEARERRVQREREDERRLGEDSKFAAINDPIVMPGLSLEDLDAGKYGLVRAELTAEHEWRSHPNAVPMTGAVYVKGLGLDGEGIAKLQIMGATGQIRNYLQAKEVSFSQIFRFKVGKQFEGISDAQTRQPYGMLRALFSRMMGWKTSYQDKGSFNTPFATHMVSGGGEATTPTDHRGSRQRRGGDSEHRRGGSDDGPKSGGGRRRQRGGGQNLLQKYLPYGKV